MNKYMCPFASCRVLYFAGDYGKDKCPGCDRQGLREVNVNA